MDSICSSSSISIPLSSHSTHPSCQLKPNSLLSCSSLPKLHLSITTPASSFPIPSRRKDSMTVSAAWTRRSRGELAERPNRKSWKQRTDMYMRPFLLNVFFSKRFIHAKVMHRNTSKVVSAASTNAEDLRYTLPSLTNDSACKVIGKLIAERSMEADVFAMSYEPQKDERIEGKLGIVIDTIKESGVIFY